MKQFEYNTRMDALDKILDGLTEVDTLISEELERVENLSVEDDVIFDDYIDLLQDLKTQHTELYSEWEAVVTTMDYLEVMQDENLFELVDGDQYEDII